MAVGTWRGIAVIAAAALNLTPGPASAWLLTEPRPDAAHRPEAKQASIDLIQQLLRIVNAWLISESNDSNLELPSSAELRAVASQFGELSREGDSASTPIAYNGERGAYASREAEQLQVELPKTYADAFRIMSDATNALAERLDAVRNSEFGPSSGADIRKRQAFSQLTGQMFRLVAIGNLLALLLQIPAS